MDVDTCGQPLVGSASTNKPESQPSQSSAAPVPHSSPSVGRKKKPPNLQLSPHSQRLSRQNAEEYSPSSGSLSDESRDDSVASQSPGSFVAVRGRAEMNDLGSNSPIVKRSSRLEQILEIPDVKAALVKDAGYEMLRRGSRDLGSRPCQGRQQTPGRQNAKDHFLFDAANPDNDSESVSESETSSLQSSMDTSCGQTSCEPSLSTAADKKRKHRSYMEPSEEDAITSPLERISNNIGPALLFGSSIEKLSRPPAPPTPPAKHERGKDRADVDETTPKPRALLSRLKFSSLSRSNSMSSMEGWDSLVRALARVGSATVPGTEKQSFDINPKLSPILKRTNSSSKQRWSADSLTQEPGTKPTMRKKTVSFSRLPNESIVKNAADCVARMHEGHQFVKMRSNSRVYNRLYWLDESGNCLRWEPSKKDAGKARIDIALIREVRPGKTTELFLTSDISNHFPDECSFSIIHGEAKSLDLIANSADDANVWITGLRCLMSGKDMEGLRMLKDGRDEWLASMFDSSDLNKDGFLDEDESFRLLTSLSGGIREFSIKQKLQEYLKLKEEDKTRLSKDEFIEIFKDVATRPEVYFLLARFSTADDQLSIDDLLNFLQSEQGVPQATNDDCLKIINDFEPSEAMRSIPALGIDGFTKYLTSNSCSIFDPSHQQVCQDMTQPLSHYFIASSHNTYLMEDQISGPSNASAYIRALLRCCRCVELDCWDGPDGQPIVTHGHNHSNPIPFVQVIEAINDSAFRNSVYPVILSLENHCAEKQQKVMVEIFHKVLGDKIYVGGLEEGNLPSPHSLRNRFLIRSKRLPADCSDEIGYVTDDDEGQEVEMTSQSPVEAAPPSGEAAKGKRPLVRDLSDLVSICSVVTLLDDLIIHRRAFNCQHTSSIHEKTAAKMVEASPDEFVAHNKKFLTRVFPSGVRVDSSNFNPQDYWNCGVQIASLNYQTPGLMMDINDGKFSMNGGCGYVLKPAIMRDPLAYYTSESVDVIPGIPPKTLYLRVISGQNFPKPRGGGAKGHVIDPYVLIELFGVGSDCAEQRTRTAPNNSGGSPIFDEAFEFRLTMPSLALVRFVVLDDDFIGDEFIGQFTIPLECLQPGYRHLRLRSIFDEPLEDATLFVHVAVATTEHFSGSSGGATPTTATGGRIAPKRGSTQKKNRKPRQRKDPASIQITEVGQPALDDLFQGAVEHLQLSSTLRESFRWSLAYFRDTCGVSALASVKQCIRALAQRCRSDLTVCEATITSRQKRKFSTPDNDETDDSAKVEARKRTSSTDGGLARLRRQTSDASQSSNESNSIVPISVQLCRHDRKISLQLKGQSLVNESWRKVSFSLEALVTDALAIIDRASSCCDALHSIYDSAASLYQDLPTLLSNGGLPEETAISAKRGSKSKKKQSLDADRRKRQTSEEHFRWNCSVIKGQREILMTSQQEAKDMLREIWEAGVQHGLASEKAAVFNGLDNAESANQNANNNQVFVPPQNTRKSSVQFMRSMSQLARSRGKSAPKRSLSTEDFRVTHL